MAGNLKDDIENKILEHSTGYAEWVKPTNTYLGLFIVAPTDSGAGTEVSAGNYTRIQIGWGAAVGGAQSNVTSIRFPATGTASADYGTVVALGVFDNVTGGNLIWYGNLSATVTIKSGDSYTITPGGITLSLD